MRFPIRRRPIKTMPGVRTPSPVRLKAPVIKKTRTTRVVIVLDRSGSMTAVRQDVVKAMNERILQLRSLASDSQVPTTVSFYTFSDILDEAIAFNEPIEHFHGIELRSYVPDGGTALWDSIAGATEDLEGIPVKKDEEVSNLVMIFTDGWNNAQNQTNDADSVNELIQRLVAKDNWSFTLCVPPGMGNKIAKELGLPEGHVMEWSTTKQGVVSMSNSVGTALSGYMANVKRGIMSTRGGSFFAPNMAAVSPKAIARNLEDLTGDFFVWTVPTEVKIAPFVRGLGHEYEPGRGFYELKEKVKVQDYKDILILDKTTARIYGGEQARQLLGIPSGGTIYLHPAYDPKYTIFVMSTSYTRILFPGTRFLYRRQA